MRNDIAACSKNWEDCTMCVQDLILPHKNITAEITKQEVDNFVRMCQMFAKQLPNCYDECSTTTQATTSKISLPSQNLEQEADFICSIEERISNTRLPAVLETRKHFEEEITSILGTYIQKFDPSLKLYPFGSTQYGVKIANANFNLLITTSEFTHEPF